MNIFQCIQAEDPIALEALLVHTPARALERNEYQRTPLMLAAKMGALDCLNMLLPYTPKNATRTPETSALALATLGDHWACVQALVDSNLCDAHHPDQTGNTPLLLAARLGHTRCVQALVPVSSVAHTDDHGWSALMHAASIGDATAVELLLPKGNPLASTSSGQTALSLAVESGNLECVQLLLPHSKVNDPNASGLTPLMMAVRNQWVEGVRALIPTSHVGTAQSSQGLTALMIAAVVGGVEIVEELLPHSEKRAVDKQGRTALALAAQHGRVELLARLSPPSPEPSPTPEQDALKWASEMGHTACVRWLLLNTPSTPERCQRALAEAVKGWHWGCVDLLALHVPEWLALDVHQKAPKHVLPSVDALIEQQALRQLLLEPGPTTTAVAQTAIEPSEECLSRVDLSPCEAPVPRRL